jgi:hypothetical protein
MGQKEPIKPRRRMSKEERASRPSFEAPHFPGGKRRAGMGNATRPGSGCPFEMSAPDECDRPPAGMAFVAGIAAPEIELADGAQAF